MEQYAWVSGQKTNKIIKPLDHQDLAHMLSKCRVSKKWLVFNETAAQQALADQTKPKVTRCHPQ